MIPGGGRRNREFFGPKVHVFDSVSPPLVELVFDPQTSGGLLIAVPDREANALLRDLRLEGNPEAEIVGRVAEQGGFAIELI
jgi:selenide,water dikinase